MNLLLFEIKNKSKFMHTIHSRIKQARTNKDLTQAELAEKLNISITAIQLWENKDETKATAIDLSKNHENIKWILSEFEEPLLINNNWFRSKNLIPDD